MTQPSTPLDDEVEQILYLHAHEPNDRDPRSGLTNEETKKLLDQAYAKQFLELDEMQDEPVNYTADMSWPLKKERLANRERNQLRSILRAAVNKMVGGA